MNNAESTKINVRPGFIDINYRILANKDDESNYYDCFIPGFNIKFSTKSQDDIVVYSKAMITSFFNYHKVKENFNALILEIHRLGFRTSKHNYIMKEILHKRIQDANFSASNSIVPEAFINSSVLEAELTEAV
uniref:hypothetical protein n=1 Tax=Flavobacterium sp. TaxID=239 RepID=UPI004048FCDF